MRRMTHPVRLAVRCCLPLAALFALAASAEPHELLIRGARPVGQAAPVDVLIREGRIAAIEPGLSSPTAHVIDGAGRWLAPGLVDAHVHLAVVPGSGQRSDDDAATEAQLRQQLAAYLACGVTTVLDTGIAPDALRRIRAWIAAGAPAPRVLSLGPGFITPGGYLSELAPDAAVASGADVERHFVELEGLDVAGVKVLIEQGFGPDPVWPIHSAEVRAAITAGARARGWPIYVHGTSEAEQALGLEMGAHALVHTGFADAAPSDAFVARLVASRAYVMTTFAIFDAALIRFEPERLDAPVFARVVPAVQLATARDPESGARLARRQAEMSAPDAPGLVHALVAWWFLGESGTRDALASTLAAALRFHRAGVPLVVGSDSGNWPIVPYQFHGPTTARELELLVEAGVPPAAALAAATTTPARMLGLGDRIGKIAVGRDADLVLLGADPSADPAALRDVRLTIRAGVARTPDEWIAAASGDVR
jgi:imidazolonepropionase-like amidohydrolase